MTTQNWPDPKRPGVPMFPERDGWHVLKWSHSTDLKWDKTPETSCGWEIWEWNSDVQKWGIVKPKGMVNEGYDYISPIVTPTQINGMLAAERERCAKICDEFTPDKASIADDAFLTGRYLALAGIAEKIRNLGAAP